MKTLIVLLGVILIAGSTFADQAISVYKPGSNGTVANGCHQIIFVMTGVWTGTIGNATFANAASTQTVIPISAQGDGKTLGAVPYTLAGAGSLIIVEVR